MNRFRYALDPLCLLTCIGYTLNRWVVPPAWKGWFLQDYFDDILFIPAALPMILWVQQRTGLRPTDGRPEWGEITFHLVVWSIAAEIIAPHLFAHAVGDPWDVVAYAGGAFLAGLIWCRP